MRRPPHSRHRHLVADPADRPVDVPDRVGVERQVRRLRRDARLHAGTDLNGRGDRRSVDVRHDDREDLARLERERARRLIEPRVGGHLVEVAEPLGNDLGLGNRARVVTRRRADPAGEVAPHLGDTHRVRETGRRVPGVREHREPVLQTGSRVRGALQVLHAHEARSRRERRAEDVGRERPAGRKPVVLVRHGKAERQDRGGVVGARIFDVRVHEERRVGVVDPYP